MEKDKGRIKGERKKGLGRGKQKAQPIKKKLQPADQLGKTNDTQGGERKRKKEKTGQRSKRYKSSEMKNIFF